MSQPSHRVIRIALAAPLLLLFLGASAWAAGGHAYYSVALKDLNFPEDVLRQADDSTHYPGSVRAEAMEPWVRIDSPKAQIADGTPDVPEGYVAFGNGYWNWYDWKVGRQVMDGTVVVRAEAGKEIAGRLYVPDSDWKRMVELKFTIPAKSADEKARDTFYRAKAAHYQLLLSRQVPGAAWFRRQEAEARAALDFKAGAMPLNAPNVWSNPSRPDDLQSTYNLFTGGRALSENLQLDRVMPNRSRPGEEEKQTVPLDSIVGLTVKEMDWKEKIKDKHPQLDPLAALIPIDQHAVFFPTFQAMTAVVDAADSEGVPVLQFAEPRAEDALTKEKYQKQLCLSLTGVGRLLGPQVIAEAAFTGSDPYLRTGSDVALLLEPKDADNPGKLKSLLSAQVSLNSRRSPGAEPVQGKVRDVEYFGARTPDRSVCVYVAQVGPALVVTNSLTQLERLIDTNDKRQESLMSAPEYVFFRDRYPRADGEKGEESALAVLTDATIRRWCGPRWRIADSRRTRAAAVLSELQAERMNDFVKGDVETTVLHTNRPLPDAGEIRLTASGVTSSTYGSLRFLTPIIELPMEKVTQAEANTYNAWRMGYQQYWSNFFDPIALRLAVKGGKVSADVTVMPLIVSSEYKQYVDMSRGVKLAPGAGDPHDALLHWVVALNHESGPVKDINDFFQRWEHGPARATFEPLGWVGESAAIYVDNDEAFWAEAAKADDVEKFFEHHIDRLPVALCVENKNGFKLAAFLTAVHAYVDQSVPGLLKWEPQKYKEQDYVKVHVALSNLGPDLPNLAIYYAATPEFLLVTPSEFVMKKALDRQAARRAEQKDGAGDKEGKEAKDHDQAKVADAPEPWLGASLAARADGQFFAALQAVFGREYRQRMQALAWGDIPILNEYKRLYPDQDPVKLHERLWHTRLVDPADGTYVWDEQYQTMSSTHFGNPAAPKEGPALPPQLESVTKAAFGVTFEDQGLRARAELERKGK